MWSVTPTVIGKIPSTVKCRLKGL